MHEEASKWDRFIVEEFLEGRLSPELSAVVQGWLTNYDRQEEKWEMVANVYYRMPASADVSDKQMQQLLKELHHILKFPIKEQRTTRTSRFRRIALRAAAVILPFLVVAGYYLFQRNVDSNQLAPTSHALYHTTDSLQDVTLGDGSVVILGKNSQITYHSDRSIKLTGEALFRVATIKGEDGVLLAFKVAAGSVKINVLGTVFAVRESSNLTNGRIALYDGKLSVEHFDIVKELRSGDLFEYDHLTNSSSVSIVSAREMIDNGFKPMLIFESSNIGNLILSLESNYNIRFIVPDNIEMDRGKISANFEGVPIQDAITLLSLIDKQHSYKLVGSSVLLEKRM